MSNPYERPNGATSPSHLGQQPPDPDGSSPADIGSANELDSQQQDDLGDPQGLPPPRADDEAILREGDEALGSAT